MLLLCGLQKKEIVSLLEGGIENQVWVDEIQKIKDEWKFGGN